MRASLRLSQQLGVNLIYWFVRTELGPVDVAVKPPADIHSVAVKLIVISSSDAEAAGSTHG